MIKDAWYAAKEILRLSADLKLAGQEHRAELSALFSRISETLETIYGKLKQDIYPAASGILLDNFAQDLFTRLQLLVGDEKAGEVSRLLKCAGKLEKLFHEITNGKIGFADLQQLEEASGKFKVGSILIQ